MFKDEIKDQLNVGSPYVLLTRNKSVVKYGLDSKEATDTNSVLLTLQEGNLISFSEKVSSDGNSGTVNPTIFIKFLDPEMVFLPRFFSQTSNRLYKTYFNKVKEISGRKPRLDKAIEEYDAFVDARHSPEETKKLLSAYPLFFSPDKLISSASDEIKKNLVLDNLSNIISFEEGERGKLLNEINKQFSSYEDNSIKLWLTYGNGGDERGGTNTAHWRKITLNSFFISQDSSENMVITLTASHGSLDSAQHKGVMSLDDVLLKRRGIYNSDPFLNSHAKQLGVPIFGAKIGDMNKPNNQPIVAGQTGYDTYFKFLPNTAADLLRKAYQAAAAKMSSNFVEAVTFYNEDIILSLLENLYQKFLLQYQPSVQAPFVFLSPKIPYAIKNIIDSEISRQDNSGTRYGLFTEPKEFRRLQVLETILNKCNITMNSGLEVTEKDLGLHIGPQDKEEQVYYLSFSPQGSNVIRFDPGRMSADGVVLTSINDLYNVLNITDSVIGNRASASVAVSITNDEHKRLFLEQFCETNVQNTSNVVSKLTPQEQSDLDFALAGFEEYPEGEGFSEYQLYNDMMRAEKKWYAARDKRIGGSHDGVSVTYANAYAIGDFGKDFKDHMAGRYASVLGGPAVMSADISGVAAWVQFTPSKVGVNKLVGIRASNIEINDFDLDNTNVKVYTDHLIGNGLITPLSPSYSNHILDIYMEQLLLPFRNTKIATKYSNAFKFLFDDVEELSKSPSSSSTKEKPMRDYIIAVARINGLLNKKETYDFIHGIPISTSEEYNTLKVMESLPIFRSNIENSNVYEVTSTEKGTSFSLLLNTLNIVKDGARSTLSSALSPKGNPRILEFSEEEFDKSFDSFFGAAFGNNATTYSLLLAMGELTKGGSSVDLITRGMWESLKKQTKKIIEDSHYMTDKEIDYAGITAHLNYVQSLSNNVAMVSVKTVPFFNLVEPLILGKPCLFLNNTNFHALTRGIASKGFLSGIYLISDYEHTISGSDCYSKFSIQRQPIATEVMLTIKGEGEQ